MLTYLTDPSRHSDTYANTVTASNAGKSYMAEITNPEHRGRYMGLYVGAAVFHTGLDPDRSSHLHSLNSFYYVGQILASGISIPTGQLKSEYSWYYPGRALLISKLSS
jgi:hypothetical protein